jgi:glutathione peroxidase
MKKRDRSLSGRVSAQIFIPLLTLLLVVGGSVQAGESCSKLLDHRLRPLMGDEPIRLCDSFAGRVALLVNTASQCGYTGQFEGLESLYQRYRAAGLVVAGFPSNDFAGQEPGSEQQIADFCRINYGVSFPMFEKIHVRQSAAHPLYAGLAAASGSYPRWNFHKYLIGRDSELLASWPSEVEPDASRLVAAIEQALKSDEMAVQE